LRRFLALIAAVVGAASFAFGLVCLIVALFDRTRLHGLGDHLAMGFFAGFCPMGLGVGFFRFAQDEWTGRPPGQKVTLRLLARVVLRGLGVLAILFGLSMAYIGFHDGEVTAAVLFISLLIGCVVPLVLGYGLVLDAETHFDPDTARSEIKHDLAIIYRLGRAVILISLCVVTFAMPLGGRVGLLVFALLVFAAEAYVRRKPAYRSRIVDSPLGPMDAAEEEVLEDIAVGTAYVLFQIILALLTGGKSLGGFVGGGGSSGGGGASGKF
jgi:hypothetical protein